MIRKYTNLLIFHANAANPASLSLYRFLRRSPLPRRKSIKENRPGGLTSARSACKITRHGGICRCGSMAEQRIRNAQVDGSTPPIGSKRAVLGTIFQVPLFLCLRSLLLSPWAAHPSRRRKKSRTPPTNRPFFESTSACALRGMMANASRTRNLEQKNLRCKAVKYCTNQ